MSDQAPNACCQDPENRTEPEKLADDLVVQRCKTCGRRHFELTAEPGALGITPS